MSKIYKASTLVSSVAMALALTGGAAFAQSAESGAPAAASGAQGLQDIIVTASRRAVSVQKESRAITAISADELVRSGVDNAAAIQNLAPGLTIATNGPQLQISIRGVGDRTINSATDPAVAINVDGVYFPKSYEASGAFFDLDRIEVLKGPQGTLYGRNASSGAINLVTAKPRFDTSGYGEVEIGNYGNQRVTGAFNVALSDVVALRVAGQVTDRQGYLSDGYGDDIKQSVRAHLLIASGDTSMLVTAGYSHLGGKSDAGVIARRFGDTPPLTSVPVPSDPWAGPTDPQTLARIAATNPDGVTQPRTDGFQDIDIFNLSVNFEHRFDWGTLTLIPSYVGARFENLAYAALVVPTWNKMKSDQYAIEGRLSSADGAAVRWVVGAFASREDADDKYQSKILPTFALPTYAPERNDDTWAVFGEANASLSDSFRLIGGVRYTWEKKTVSGATAPVFGPIPEFPLPITGSIADLPGASDISGRRIDKAVNFRAGAEYDVAPQVMVYATVATGFKAGGFYNDIAPSNSYKPEKLTAYTAGLKSRFMDNRLQLNIEGFYWDYTDKQETFLGFGSVPGSVILLTKNAASARLYGADVSVAAQITPTTQLSAEVEYNDNKYNTYIVDTLAGPIDNSGEQLVRAPKWSGHVSFDQAIPLADSMGELSFNAQMRFTSSYWLTNDFVPIERQTAYQVYDASLQWVSPGKAVTLTGYVKNIGNKVYYSGGVVSDNLRDAVVGQIGAPRTYGARLRLTF
ncbi:TonB-dependent receptor [Sphingobium jiangsuense]|uniref:Iron complex outermembrane receptor protein n=1 Tax=Sphingobium jiangsuense TaxID=870476 RepID=A0A7W6BLM1_9SPHN|nr:TonB-dependent receptor [Sphingobium jiangsuense]MBB3927377.1 iron complex outermembrane receptor protein [Sphingobium jiangsuense]GLT00779.1 TonB-dependent receptor [Sphingobium jiangsuense]